MLKIAIVVYSLSKGGAERASAILSKLLTKAGHQVTIICVTDDLDYAYDGQLINLDQIVYPKTGLAKRWAKIKYVKNVLQQMQFDYVIDTRSRRSLLKQFVIAKILLSKQRTIYMVHNYHLRLYFSKYRILARFVYNNAYKMVGVSKAIVQKVHREYGFTQCICIYNAFDHDIIYKQAEVKVSLPKEPYILAYGRLVDKVKDYSFLLRAYKKSKVADQGIKLLILGDGPDKEKLKTWVKVNDLSLDVQFISFTSNPFPYVKNALFTTLTSNYEGFPMILVEAMALGTPVVAVSCKSGPSEIIETGKNGVLVPFKSEPAFINAIQKMCADKEFYQKCKQGTFKSVHKFNMKNIAQQWNQILK